MLDNIITTTVSDNNESTPKNFVLKFLTEEDRSFCCRFILQSLPELNVTKVEEFISILVCVTGDELFRIISALKLRGIQHKILQIQ